MVGVIAVGGKQYLVAVGQIIRIDGLNLNEGEIVEYPDILNSGQTVRAKVVASGRGKKVKILKFKNKTRYLRRGGYRKSYSVMEILEGRKNIKK